MNNMLNLNSKNNYSLHEFIKDLLKKRFPNDQLKQEINDEDRDKLNFACPYCGDSIKDSSKKRGNIYHRNSSFKCFNGGCLKWVPLKSFISTFAQKYSLSIPDVKLEDKSESEHLHIFNKRAELIQFLMDPNVKQNILDFDEIYSRFFFTPCIDAPADSDIGKYIRNRNLLDAPGFEQSCYYDESKGDRIYIFNLDLKTGKMLGFSMRSIDPNYTGSKYNMKSYSEFVETGLIQPISKDILIKLDTINGFFNILNISFSKPVIITEGQINAMFIKNAIATTGVTKSKSILGTIITKKNALILFDNDKAGKTETMKLLQEGYKVFLWSKLIVDLKKQYSEYIKYINEINDVNDLYSFYIKVGDPKTIDEFNSIILEYFSDSLYDLIEI
jgi:hypothetical protein